MTLLPPALLTALNEQLEKLGYPPLDQSWNSAERDVDAGGTGLWAGRLETFMGQAVISSTPGRVEEFAVVAEDHRRLRWVVDVTAGTVRQGDGDVDGVLTGTAENLVLALSKEQNLGVLLRSGRVRYLTGEELDGGSGVRRNHFADELDEIIAVLGSITRAQG